ncbi:LAQU0S17e00518g1_1 [Lachancea quebecensis]|uniref:Phosphatidylserine decarboxylase proenzyme 2 n=1 Tax=Lachancea quebecensis TaxID=1654605 RepID=A0A0P1KW59_9SACH|nr:LAQU0S17e00518g1_1 [Lachancea quebecensis]
MGIIRRRSRRARLTLRVHAIQAHDITMQNSGCNPVCLVTSNGVFSRTPKLKNTTSPHWDQMLKLKLPERPTSEYLRVVVYDALASTVDESAVDEFHARGAGLNDLDSSAKYLYLGETQLSLRDLFRRKDQPTSYKFSRDAAWYPLYNKNALRFEHTDMQNASAAMAVGEIQLAMSLSCTKGQSLFKAFNSWQNAFPEPRSSSSMSSSISAAAKSGSDGPSSSAAGSGIFDDFDEETDFDLITQNPSGDELEQTENDLESLQYIYSKLEDEDGVEGISSSDDELEPGTQLNFTKVATALDEYDVAISRSDFDPSSGNSRVSTPPLISEDDLVDEDNASSSDSKESRYMSMIQTRKRRPRRPRIGNSSAKFELSKRGHAAGVAYVDIDSINDLPTLKNKFSKKYMMDPFIIITFGRRVFKTSWRKHSLNPVYNERLAFEVYENEMNFSLHFRIIDKDNFSYHNNVAKGDISLTDLINRQQESEAGDEWISMHIPLQFNKTIDSSISPPVLNLKSKFVSYTDLKKHFWEKALNLLTKLETFDVVDINLLMGKLGSFSDEEIEDFFYFFGKSPWAHNKLSRDEVISYLQQSKNSSGFKKLKKCPLCSCWCKSTRNVVKSKLILENDLVTHLSICSSNDEKKKILKASYVSSDFASKRWFSKFLIKLTYGKYALGSNNANILVQDRDTGIVLEEKISAHVKVGIRIIYNARGTESKKFKTLLRNLSVKQGRKFDNPTSVRQIDSFIRFHSLDTSECEETEYKTFNEFFYRKLKPGSRSPEVENPEILLSPADCRCTVFSNIKASKEIWIKGKTFTITKLTNSYHPEIYNDASCSIGIFRLAPQDYHRFHCPCDGVIGKPQEISGEYYTVNPMAVRTELDVFGENVRVVVPIHSKEFGTILYVAVGAMMVGSIILTCKEGDTVERGQELGYFKFGGSTILLVVPSQKVMFDTDLLNNSNERIETLVKVGMSIGHTPAVKEHKREKRVLHSKEDIDRIKRTISVSDETVEKADNAPWEYHNLRKLAPQHSSADIAVSSDPTETARELDLLSIFSD